MVIEKFAGLIDLSSTKDNIKEVNTAFSQGEKGRYTGFHNVFGKAKASKRRTKKFIIRFLELLRPGQIRQIRADCKRNGRELSIGEAAYRINKRGPDPG